MQTTAHMGPHTETVPLVFSQKSSAQTVSSHYIFRHLSCRICRVRIVGLATTNFYINGLTSLHKMVTAKKSVEINSFRRLLQREERKFPSAKNKHRPFRHPWELGLGLLVCSCFQFIVTERVLCPSLLHVPPNLHLNEKEDESCALTAQAFARGFIHRRRKQQPCQALQPACPMELAWGRTCHPQQHAGQVLSPQPSLCWCKYTDAV